MRRITRALHKARRWLTGKDEKEARAEVDFDTWKVLLSAQAELWQHAREAAKDGSRVLIATSLGGFPYGTLVESALSVALTLRGARPEVLLCNSFLPACQLTEIKSTPPERLVTSPPQPRCKTCQPAGESVFDPLELPIHRYGDLVERQQLDEAHRIASTIPFAEIDNYEYNSLAVGEHALAGALRYFASGYLEVEPQRELVLRRYLEASLRSVFAVQNLLQRNHYKVACFNHGIYVPQGLIGEVCRQQGVRVVNWNPAYRKHSFIFSHNDTYHHTMITEPASDWENVSWTSETEKLTLSYLKSRRHGTQDWIRFHPEPQEDLSQITQEIGVDFSHPCVVLLTSVMWDAQLHYRSNAFSNMVEWVLHTIEYFSRRPEVQLVIRIHPAEMTGSVPSRQLIAEEIKGRFPSLPPNIFVIPPQSHVSTYTLVDNCNAALIYNTKTGIEISSLGIPVIVAGEAWIRNKGFSLDASSPEEYSRLLDRLPFEKGLSAAELIRARKYAFHFFFRRMIPLPFVTAEKGKAFNVSLHLSSIEELQEGRYCGLDTICDGILQGTPFIYPAETLPHAGHDELLC